MAKSTGVMEVPAIAVAHSAFHVVGRGLISHRFSEKARKQIEAKQQKKATRARPPKKPLEEFRGALYCFQGEETRYGFPATGFKSAMVRAGKLLGLVMTDLRQMFFVQGDGLGEGGEDLVEIHGTPEMHTSMVRLKGGVSDVRYRAIFPEWWARLVIEHKSDQILTEQLANLLNHAGFSVGIGDWRPEKNGTNGRFTLATEEHLKRIQEVA